MRRIGTSFLLILLCLAGNAAAAGETPRVRLETTAGDIVVELFPDKAPKTVENFLEYVDGGFYDGTVFHRVIEGFMIQGGGFTPDYQRKETRAPIENEGDNGLANERGTIAMARTGDPHSATSQFFINTVDNISLDFRAKSARGWGYAVFGRVVEGMDTVDRIESVSTHTADMGLRNVPTEPIVIEKAVREKPAATSGGKAESKGKTEETKGNKSE